MANRESARVTNMLEYIPNKAALSQEAWNASPALMIYKLHKDLQLAAKMYPVVDPKTSVKYMANWALEASFETRSTMSTYPGGQGAVNVGVRKNVNDLLPGSSGTMPCEGITLLVRARPVAASWAACVCMCPPPLPSTAAGPL